MDILKELHAWGNTFIMVLIALIGWFVRSEVKEIKDRVWRLEEWYFSSAMNGQDTGPHRAKRGAK